MDLPLTDDFMTEAFQVTLGRAPTELEIGASRYLAQTRGPRAFLLDLCSKRVPGDETARDIAPLFITPGHYYSPIVDVASPAIAGLQVDRTAAAAPRALTIDTARMLALFDRLARHFPAFTFPAAKQDSHRYHTDNAFYGYGDALIYASLLRQYRPRTVIEVGSGFSSAVLLDTLDAAGLGATRCIFIEPYTERLRSLLTPADEQRVEIIELPLQDVTLDRFKVLEAGDIFFVDSTHVSKTASDVNTVIFDILPSLASGVLIHFHDVFWPFEYPNEWIVDGRSWNEIYILRAFLMDNTRYEVLYFNHLMHTLHADHVARSAPLTAQHPGGALWLRKL